MRGEGRDRFRRGEKQQEGDGREAGKKGGGGVKVPTTDFLKISLHNACFLGRLESDKKSLLPLFDVNCHL